jgi:hypothetical protein
MSILQRRHYETVADAMYSTLVRTYKPDVRAIHASELFVRVFAKELAKRNRNMDSKKFFERCGLHECNTKKQKKEK